MAPSSSSVFSSLNCFSRRFEDEIGRKAEKARQACSCWQPCCFGRIQVTRQVPGWTSPQQAIYPTISLNGENSPPPKRVTPPWCGTHFSCQRDQEKKKDCMERLGTSPSRGPPPIGNLSILRCAKRMCSNKSRHRP